MITYPRHILIRLLPIVILVGLITVVIYFVNRPTKLIVVTAHTIENVKPAISVATKNYVGPVFVRNVIKLNSTLG